MRHGRSLVLLFVSVLVILACARREPATIPTGAEPAPAVRPQQSRTLTILMRVEPQELSEGTEDRAWLHVPLFNAPLAAWNLRGAPFPVLAEAVPQLNSDTWRVLPDGRM